MSETTRNQKAYQIQQDWATNPRWEGIKREYTADQVVRLQGSNPIEYSLARRGAEKLWRSLKETRLYQQSGSPNRHAGLATSQGRSQGEFIYQDGKWQVMPTWLVRCIQINHYTRRIQCRQW